MYTNRSAIWVGKNCKSIASLGPLEGNRMFNSPLDIAIESDKDLEVNFMRRSSGR